jgi:TRAP-type C4-dicarboxylate transport system permease small subunit
MGEAVPLLPTGHLEAVRSKVHYARDTLSEWFPQRWARLTFQGLLVSSLTFSGFGLGSAALGYGGGTVNASVPVQQMTVTHLAQQPSRPLGESEGPAMDFAPEQLPMEGMHWSLPVAQEPYHP